MSDGRVGARVLVVGCGAIGGTIAAALAEQPRDTVAEVVAISRNAGVVASVAARGMQLRGEDGARTVRATVLSEIPKDAAPFDWLFLTTHPPEVEEAAREALPYLAGHGAMVCFQNGLCEDRVAKIAGRDRVVGAVVAWGASMPEPGVFERTSSGGFTIGRLDGTDDPRLSELATLLEPIGAVEITRDLAGARWSKLAINCAISTLGTIGGDRLGPLMMHRFVRRLALEVMTEAVHVARAEGVRLQKVSGTIDLDWIALTESERRGATPSLVAKHSLLLAVGARYRRLRSSMLAAIERGRTPAVDFLNGEVVDRGRARGVPAPVNAAARDLVHAIARGERRPGLDTLRELAMLTSSPDREE